MLTKDNISRHFFSVSFFRTNTPRLSIWLQFKEDFDIIVQLKGEKVFLKAANGKSQITLLC
jgi:hypothetical protein